MASATRPLLRKLALVSVVITLVFSSSTGTLTRQSSLELQPRRAEPYTPPIVANDEVKTRYGHDWRVQPSIHVPPPNDLEISQARDKKPQSEQQVLGLVRKLPQPLSVSVPADVVPTAVREWQGGVLGVSPTGRVVWSGALRTESAGAVSLALSNLRMPRDAVWRVYGESGQVHEFSPASPDADTPIVPGDAIWLEIEVPISRGEALSFQVDALSYFFAKTSVDAAEDSRFALEFINAECATAGSTPAHEALRNLQNAVGLMARKVNNTAWAGFCTGTLINNTREPGVPYFMTAHHCIEPLTPGSRAGFTVFWDYRNAFCNGSTLPWDSGRLGALPQSPGGTLLVSGDADTNADFALFKLDSLPDNGAGRHFVGWSTFPISSDFYRISNPAGRPQMYSRHEWRHQEWREDCEWWEILLGTCSVACPGRAYDRFYYATPKDGLIAQGSSGSAAINISPTGANYFVGQLWGFCALKYDPRAPVDRITDGALNYYYDRVAAWLDPPNECQNILLEVYPNGSTGVVGKTTAPNCGGNYRAGTRVWIRAIPDPGYEFDHWDAGVIENPLSAETYATIRADITPVYRAYFRPATPPANDRCGLATLVTRSPFIETITTTGATTDTDHDPVPSCFASRAKNVWYRFTADAAAPITIDTSSSSDSTVIAVYRGDDCFALTQTACSAAPLATTTNSALQFVPTPGERYKIQIAAKTPTAISSLTVKIEGPIANQPPIANGATFDARFGSFTEPFPALDPEGGPLTFQIVRPPAQGTLAVDQSFGEFTYTPHSGTLAEDSFDYVVNDGIQDSAAPATIRLTLLAPLALTVNSTADVADDVPGNGVCHAAGFGCTLRAAITEVNALGGRPGIITLPAGVFSITGAPGEDLNASGDLDIRAPIEMQGAGAQDTVIQSNTADRVLDVVVNTTARMSRLTVRNGRVSGRGGGIRSIGVLLLEDVVVSDNAATDEGGGISAGGGLSVVRSSIVRNAADGGVNSGSGAGGLRVNGTAVLLNATVANNFSDGPGGAIRNYGRLLAGYSTIIDNTTRAGATAIDTWSFDDPALSIKSNIVSGSCHVTSGTVVSFGYNLVTAASCAPHPLDRVVAVLGLSPLAVQPGGTFGAPPMTGSPVIDTTPEVSCLDWVDHLVDGDQRNALRPRDGNGDGTAACDAGAFEADTLPPVAANDAYVTGFAATLIVAAPGVLANDDAKGGGAMTATLVAPASHGGVSLSPDGGFAYAPSPLFSGTDSFTYRATNSGGSGSVATVTITVNAAPVPSSTADSYVTAFNTPLAIAAPGVLANDNGNGGGVMTAALIAPASHGAVSLSADGGFAYTPSPLFSGADSFTYRASNSGGSGNVATVTITVNVALVPSSTADSYVTALNTPLAIAAPGVLANDNSNGGGAMSAGVVNGATHGTAALDADGGFTYIPEPSFDGTDSFTYRATNAGGAGNIAVVTIAVGNPTTPQPPLGFVASSISGNIVTFRWTKPATGPAPENYAIEGGLTPGTVLGTLNTGSSNPIFVTELPSGSFYVRVYAIAGGVRSATSNEMRVHVNAPMPPSAPADFLASVNGSSLQLSWRSTYEGGEPQGTILDVTGPVSVSLPLGAGESASFAAVPTGTYILALRAMNSAGTSGASAPLTVAVPGSCAGAPLGPANVLAYKLGTRLSLVWDPPASGPAVSGYLLQVSGALNVTLPMSTRSISGNVPPGTYILSVTAVNACGSSAPSGVQTLAVP